MRSLGRIRHTNTVVPPPPAPSQAPTSESDDTLHFECSSKILSSPDDVLLLRRGGHIPDDADEPSTPPLPPALHAAASWGTSVGLPLVIDASLGSSSPGDVLLLRRWRFLGRHGRHLEGTLSATDPARPCVAGVRAPTPLDVALLSGKKITKTLPYIVMMIFHATACVHTTASCFDHGASPPSSVLLVLDHFLRGSPPLRAASQHVCLQLRVVPAGRTLVLMPTSTQVGLAVSCNAFGLVEFLVRLSSNDPPPSRPALLVVIVSLRGPSPSPLLTAAAITVGCLPPLGVSGALMYLYVVRQAT
ncbi:hypothetical protein R3P38DRAFT_3203593 [Favolaschia claudopus]|uniref:Uncharacterized protein n=1 Tax=Favolaschia claudopus TaxID=2862362 RepID=A0AAW0ASM4_9AGAR